MVRRPLRGVLPVRRGLLALRGQLALLVRRARKGRQARRVRRASRGRRATRGQLGQLDRRGLRDRLDQERCHLWLILLSCSGAVTRVRTLSWLSPHLLLTQIRLTRESFGPT